MANNEYKKPSIPNLRNRHSDSVKFLGFDDTCDTYHLEAKMHPITKTFLKANALAVKLGQATKSNHVTVTITPRRWYHNLSRQIRWQQEWCRTLWF